MRNILDFHTHVFPDNVEEKAVSFLEDYYHIPIKNKATINELDKSMNKAGVTKAVIHATATKSSQVRNINNWISTLISDKYIGFGSIHPEYENINEELERMKDLGLKGVKLHPDFQHYYIDEDKMCNVYDKIGGKFPILIHMGDENTDYSRPKRLSNVLKMFPNVTFIAAHLGGYSKWDEVMTSLVGKNLYFDTSSALWALDAHVATEIIYKHGVEKILFGTDYPIMSHEDELKLFMKLKLNEEDRVKILWKNGMKIFE